VAGGEARPVLDLLRPKPFRGDVIAAGVVVLVTLVVTVALRFSERWDPSTHVAYITVAWAFVTAMAGLAELEGEHPRAYQSILYVASVVLFAAGLVALVLVIARHHHLDAQGTIAVVGGVVAVYATCFAITRNSAVCTLIASLAGGIALLYGVAALWGPVSAATQRWVLLAVAAVLGVLAIGQRDRRPRHGVALIDAAGLAILVIAVTFVTTVTVELVGDGSSASAPHPGWGWELLILAAGFGLIAYSSVDRQPGPAYIGVLNLLGFVIVAARPGDLDASLAGWPLVLAIAAALLLALGLRPTTPAPPPPDYDAPAPPPLPLR
jgi:hypothetical protein